MTATRLLAPEQRGFTFATMATISVAAYNSLSVTAALPAIGDQFGNLEWLPWVVTVELVGAAIATVAIGPVVDAVGSRSINQVLLGVLLGTSVLCALSPNLWFLIGARFLQGLGAGALIANTLAAMGLGVPPKLRARAYAVNSTVWGVMGVAGPALAAILLVAFGWRSIFLINVPVVLFAGLVGWRSYPGPAAGARRVASDWRGLSIMSVFTVSALIGISTLGLWTIPALAVAGLALGSYLAHERRVEHPVLRLRHVTNPDLRWLHVTAMFVITSGMAANVFLPLFVKGARGGSTGEAAFSVFYFTVGWTIGAFVTSKATETRRSQDVIFFTAVVLTTALATATTMVWLEGPLWALFPVMIAIGSGLGGVSSTGVALLQSVAPPTEMGRVNSAHQFLRSLGFSYGAAIGGAVLFTVVALQLGDADAVRDLLADEVAVVDTDAASALTDGFTWALGVSATLAAAAVLAATRLQRQTFPEPAA